MSVFSKNLRYLRESRGLKLDEFEFLGIKKGTMSNYELGNTEPKLSLLCEISKFFRISIDDFLLNCHCPDDRKPEYPQRRLCKNG